MDKFLVRVELHGVRDYLPLHEAMRQSKFKRVIRRADGKRFTLPTGEYRYNGGATIGVIMKRARKVMSSVNYGDASILVCQIHGSSRFSKLREETDTQ
jgi:hypothetical protein